MSIQFGRVEAKHFALKQFSEKLAIEPHASDISADYPRPKSLFLGGISNPLQMFEATSTLFKKIWTRLQIGFPLATSV